MTRPSASGRKAKNAPSSKPNAPSNKSGGRKLRKMKKPKTNKTANGNGSHSAASSSKNSSKKERVPGHCDVCQMSDLFKNMVLLQCHECGVQVHDRCYGIDAFNYGTRDPTFRCWPCRAVGTKTKVREKDPATNQRRLVSQPRRPTACCLCSIDDGIHAMHPVFDSHGTRGRHIWLPPDEQTGARTLAWAHTLCALTINSAGPTKGCFYGCTSTGYYDPDDLEHVSDSESVNSTLLQETPVDNVHHYVYWGHYDRYRGQSVDEHGRTFETAKTARLQCIYCGKDDDKVIQLNGQVVFQSLRVPLQCTANDSGEFRDFKAWHKGYEHCYQPLHAGCAMWGRNEDGEYSLVRRSWYFPGIQTLTNKRARNPVVEVYCDCHARDLFLQVGVGKGSNMQDRLPGPFVALAGAPKRRWLKQQAEDAAAKAPAPPKRNMARGSVKVSALKTMRPAGTPIVPGQARRASATTTAKPGRGSAPAISLHGATRKKKARELENAGEAVVVQTEKHGRLVAKRNSSTAAAQPLRVVGAGGGNGDDVESLAQRIWETLVAEKKKCPDLDKPLDDAKITAPLRIRWLKTSTQEGIDKDRFHASWRRALDAAKKGTTLVVEKSNEKESRKRSATESSLSDASSAMPAKKRRVPKGKVNPFQFDDSSQETHDADQGAYLSETESFKEPAQPTKTRSALGAAKAASVDSHKEGSVSTSGVKSTNGGGQSQSNSSQQPPPPQQQQQQQREELIQKMVTELLSKLEPYGYKDEGDEKSASEVGAILKDCRSRWKKKSGLSKADFKAAFDDVKNELSRKCSWLEFGGKPSSPEKTTPSKNSVQRDQTDTAAVESPQSTEADKQRMEKRLLIVDEMPVADLVDLNSSASDSAPRSFVQDQSNDTISESDLHQESSSDRSPGSPNTGNTGSGEVNSDEVNSMQIPSPVQALPPMDSPDEKPPNRWSHLSYGRHYNRAGYSFKEWDTFEEVT